MTSFERQLFIEQALEFADATSVTYEPVYAYEVSEVRSIDL